MEAIFLLFALSVSVPVLAGQEQYLQDPASCLFFGTDKLKGSETRKHVCYSLATYTGKTFLIEKEVDF